MEFGYWGIKGLGETSRLVAAYAGVELKEYNPASREEWGQKKAEFGAQFANLPYIVDGDFKLTESSAIPVYIAHKGGKTELLGKDAKEQAQVVQLAGVIGDIRQNVMKGLFGKDGHKEAYEEIFKAGSATSAKIEQLSLFLGDKEFFLGHVTLADFYYAYFSRFFQAVAKAVGVESPFDRHDNLKKLVASVEGLAGVKELVEKRRQVPYMPPGMLALNIPTDAEVLGQ